jgi:hypothetical protein
MRTLYGHDRRVGACSAEGGNCLNLNQLVRVAKTATPSGVLGASWSPKCRLTTSQAVSRSARR